MDWQSCTFCEILLTNIELNDESFTYMKLQIFLLSNFGRIMYILKWQHRFCVDVYYRRWDIVSTVKDVSSFVYCWRQASCQFPLTALRQSPLCMCGFYIAQTGRPKLGMWKSDSGVWFFWRDSEFPFHQLELSGDVFVSSPVRFGTVCQQSSGFTHFWYSGWPLLTSECNPVWTV